MDLIDLFKLIYQQAIPIKFILYMLIIAIIIKIIMVIQDSFIDEKPLRKHPPCALFFHKKGNKCITIVGPYEESYLNPAEKKLWRKRKLERALRRQKEKAKTDKARCYLP